MYLVVTIEQVKEENTNRENNKLGWFGEIHQIEAQDFNMSPTLRNSFDLDFQLTLPTWPPYSYCPIVKGDVFFPGLLPGILALVFTEVEGSSEPFCSGFSICKAG